MGGQGADYLDGGAGIDLASYLSSLGGVQVDLAAHAGHGGDAEGDTLVSIEDLLGSLFNDVLKGDGGANSLFGLDGNDFLDGGAGRDALNGGVGNDTLSGGADDDTLSGWDGDDTLDGGHGADVLDGGSGIDTLSYASSSAAVTVNLAANAASGGDAFLDTVSNFENLTGSAFADMLTGDGSANVVQGLAGNDWIDGGAGADRLLGGDGNDTMTGGSGADSLDGGAGADLMTGGADADTFMFAAVNQTAADGTTIAPGIDRVTDFVVGVDHLEFSGIDSLYGLAFAQVGADTVITYAQADGAITLVGVDLDELLAHHVTDLLLA